jgi:hypothetical protein
LIFERAGPSLVTVSKGIATAMPFFLASPELVLLRKPLQADAKNHKQARPFRV